MVDIIQTTDLSGDNIFTITKTVGSVTDIKTLTYKSYEVLDKDEVTYSIFSEGVLVFQDFYSNLQTPAGTPASQYADLQNLFNVPDTSVSIDTTLNNIYSTLLNINNIQTVEESLRVNLSIDNYDTNALGSTLNLVQSRMFYGYRLFNPNSVTAYIRFKSASLGDIVHVLPAGQVVDVQKSNVSDLGLIDTVDLDKNRNFTYLGTNFTLPVVIRLKY